MKRLFISLVFFTFSSILTNCSTKTTPTPVSLPTSLSANIDCDNFSFYLDPALGEGYQCENVIEKSSSDLPSYYPLIYPTHIELTIQDYSLSKTQFPPSIWIYPVRRFKELLPNILPNRIADLENLIGKRNCGVQPLPFLPLVFEQQTLVSHCAYITFTGGKGVRFITEYSEGPMPITNLNIIYTFQGLTDDGKYWVAATLPISSPTLPLAYDILPEGYTDENLIENYTDYVREIKNTLNALSPDSFSPTLDLLDSLVKSMTVSPLY